VVFFGGDLESIRCVIIYIYCKVLYRALQYNGLLNERKVIMKILYTDSVKMHNEISEAEGAYRVNDFVESVSVEELESLRSLTERLIKTVHTPRYVQKVKGACMSKCELAEVQLAPASYEAMIASATLAIMAARDRSFAVTRPPGHHASREKAEGFCFFNNIAIATNYLLEQGQRVCVIDIDGHHGNGTQSIFKKDGRVFFASIHQSRVYPYSGLANDIGNGQSYKKVINIPVPDGSGDDVFLKALTFIVEQVKVFAPDCVAVSAGFDGYAKDALLNLKYSKHGYYEAGKLISSIGKPVFAVLEGGYHSEVKSCAEAFTAGILEENFVTEEIPSTSSDICMKTTDGVLQEISSLLK